MTDRELMQMALDALEEAKENVMDWGSYASEYFKTKHGLAQDILAIENISEALRARLAQPEQEPYCYTWDRWISGGNWEAQYGWEPYCGGKRPEHSTEAKPLYTTPQQREWQGLTDEEMFSLWVRCPAETENRFAFARAVEAKLKEKNT